jgi:hypothetical protein
MALRIKEKGINSFLHENDMKYCEHLARVATMEYCCPERRRLQVDCRYGLIHLDNDTNQFTIFGSFEGEDWDDTPPFQMIYCMFCGAKL